MSTLNGKTILLAHRIMVGLGKGQCKRVFYLIIETRKLKDEVFSTRFCLVEHSLKARSVTHVAPISTDLEDLKPNYFLFLRPKKLILRLLLETKSRINEGVAPIKALSIPKLEFQAALLASKMKVDIPRDLSIHVTSTILWTDRTTVLQELHSVDQLQTFVANCVREKK